MKILGIDPGMAIVGYGMIGVNNDETELLTSGSIQTDKKLSDSARLLEIYNDMCEIVDKYKPDCASVEKLFFFKNQKTVIPTYEYTPMEVKQVLTGYGRAEKKEVDHMVHLALQTEDLPKLDDTVDAIAIAICHSRSLY